jgi:hypothetical protein
MFCVRLRETGRLIDAPPMFLAAGGLLGDVPSDLLVLPTRARAVAKIQDRPAPWRHLGYHADVVTLRYALGWAKASIDVSGGFGRCHEHRGLRASHEEVIGCLDCAGNAYQRAHYMRLHGLLTPLSV